MNIADSLSTIAEFSIGLAGFTAIVAIFANSREKVGATMLLRTMNLLVISFVPGFIALLLLVLLSLPVDSNPIIRITSSTFVLYLLTITFYQYRSRRNMTEVERQKLNPIIWLVCLCITLTTIGLQIVGLSSTIAIGTGMLLLGMVMHLILGALIFSIIIISILRGSAGVT